MKIIKYLHPGNKFKKWKNLITLLATVAKNQILRINLMKDV